MATISKTSKKIDLLYCVGCGRMTDSSEFNTSKNPNHKNGYLPYCKKCCTGIFQDRLTRMKSIEGATYMTCAEIGIPFFREIYDKYTAEYKNRKLNMSFAGYYNKLNTQKIKLWSGFWETDVDFNDIAGVSAQEQLIQNDVKKYRLLWGKDKTPEQLNFLQFTYDKLVGDEFITDYQESLYRDLCRAELEIYENGDVDSAIKRKQSLGKSLGLDSVKVNKELSLVEKLLEKQIFTMETEEPAYHYSDLEKYADFMGIGNYWNNHILRPIKNLLLGQKEYKIIKDEEE